MDKRITGPMLLIGLLLLAFCPSVHSDQTISKSQVVSDTLQQNTYKVYSLSEQLPKGCVFTLFLKVDSGSGYGYVFLQRGTETVYEWVAGTGSLAAFSIAFPTYYSAYITRGGLYSLNVSAINFGGPLSYTFFYDFSEQLEANNSKLIPLEGGTASFYADLNSGDTVSMNLTSPSGSDFDVQVFSGYSYLMIVPPVASTLSPGSTKTLSFTALNTARHFVFVTAGTGNGTFSLQSSVTPLTPTYEQLQSNYNQLNSTYQNLLTQNSNLQTNYNSLANDLNNTKNLVYIVLAITLIIIVINVYHIAKKPPANKETKNQ